MRPRAKFLTVVWGEAYIARFATLALPSFLAPGNLPALAQATDLEVVIMTRRDDIAYFENHATFLRLRAICAVRFVEIDDLITTTVYGVTLTLAYARPVIACGSEMLNTHFVFMNADFVLADGSLRALCKHITGGRSIVLGPSFRATAEAVEPHLQSGVDSRSGVLSVPPRQLAALSLAHPHPTTMAKTLNQGFCHSTHPNQFFWQVDEQTMLGRYYLIFMLCLKPERIIKTINCFCDYAFIPEMCPSGDEVVMNDSDDFFMLELQSHDQEMHLLQLGRQSDEEIARSLREWTTAEHRRAAGYDVVFHAGEIPAEIETAKAEARAFVGRVGRMLGRPVPHTAHQYWIRGVAAWRNYRKAQELPASPPELASDDFRLRDFLRRIWGGNMRWNSSIMPIVLAVHRAIMGQAPWVTLVHPDWIDFRHLRATLAALLEVPGARVLVVHNSPELVNDLVSPDTPVRLATVREVLIDGAPLSDQAASRPTHCLIYLLRKDCRSAQELVERCQLAMVSGGTCQVFIHHLHGETEQGNFSHELVRYVEDIIGCPPQATACSFVGNPLKHFTGSLFIGLRSHYAHFGILALLWILPLLAIGLPLALIGNLYLLRKAPRHDYVRYCSSAVIRFGPIENPPGMRTGG